MLPAHKGDKAMSIGSKRSNIGIISVFGQIESVVADCMVTEGKATKIKFEDIPISARYNDKDQPAYCALIISRESELEFDRRVAALYA
jgi:hypothetical protein